ncbi:phosphoserine phosphatase SerB [Salinibius halmophilus]|uniref:phosphoserine phosphatase SerB n=1 Tax=Salinibius halmophilus TaxID=1853216 RepID=UPI000E6607CB|nr:phosphoserine phosphatase SerB [Salinibius halmophilus]
MSDIVLVTVTGPDRPGITAQFSHIMAQANLRILDMGQSVIHNNVSLGMLVSLPDDQSQVVRDLLFKAHELGLTLKLSPVKSAEYESWVASQGQQKHVVTLLARQITAEHIAKMSAVVTEHGLNIESITRLTGRESLQSDTNSSKACIEMSLYGQPTNSDSMRAAFLNISAEHNVDIAFQEDSIWRRNRRLVVFDMDSTLIEAEVIDELAIEAGVGEQVADITEAAMRGEIDFQESFRQRLALLEGLSEDVLQGVAERLVITEGAEHLISTLNTLGYKTAIISGGFTYFAQYLQKRLGIDYIHANELEIVDGKVTGQVKGIIVDGARKAELLQEIAASLGIRLQQVIAVGDGANDLPMLSVAGLGIAFRAKPIVKESAKQSISTLGLDSILYLLGYRDRDAM